MQTDHDKEMGDWTSPVREREGQKSREYYINISQNIEYGQFYPKF